MQIAITDLTRFNNGAFVCTAGLDVASGRCIRPMDPSYISTQAVIKHGLKVGHILEGDFSPTRNNAAPHTEDHRYTQMKLVGELPHGEFKHLLTNSLSRSVNSGFQNLIPPGEKYIPINTPPDKSIITIQSRRAELCFDSFKEGKVRISFIDAMSTWYKFISVTDYWLIDKINSQPEFLYTLNDQIARTGCILRVGLGRCFEPVAGKNGYWLQVNSIIGI